MAAFNVVRFRVKPGCEQAFVDAHRVMKPDMKGFRGGSLIRTGDRTFCMIGEWVSFQKIVEARPMMIGLLDSVRELLEDLGGEMGVTDPVSGEVVAALKSPAPKKKAVARKKKAKTKTKAKAKAKAKRKK
jgi:hypothetical protein